MVAPVSDSSGIQSNFKRFAQNIGGLSNKIYELVLQWVQNPPHIICLTEHHLKTEALQGITVDNFNLGAFYYPLSYRVPVRERYGSTLLPATREQHDQNCTQSH